MFWEFHQHIFFDLISFGRLQPIIISLKDNFLANFQGIVGPSRRLAACWNLMFVVV